MRAVLMLLVLVSFVAADTVGYQKPPETIQKILDQPAPPTVTLSRNRDYLVLTMRQRYPSITDLSRPILRLAGLRLDPQTNGPQRQPRTTGIVLQPIDGGKDIPLVFPEGVVPGALEWSPDGKRFVVVGTSSDGIYLLLGSPEQPKLQRLLPSRLNGAYGDPVAWLPDSKTLLVRLIPTDRGQPPTAPTVPTGPVIQESTGKPSPARTYQDLLKDRHDEALFDYYCTSQLALLDITSKTLTPLGKPGLYSSAAPSPDGKYLLVTRTKRPYSYLLPASFFPRITEVWQLPSGKAVKVVAEQPLQDNIPIEGVATGPRSISWRPDVPATLVWVEALDDGNPNKKVPFRDKVVSLAAPFTEEPKELARTEHRFGGLQFGEKNLALLVDFDRETRRRRTFQIQPDTPEQPRRLIWDRSIQDRYRDPGTPVLKRLGSGYSVLRQEGDDLFLTGDGASPRGNRPFLDRMNLKTLKTERLFQSADDCLESVVSLLSVEGPTFVTRHESPTSPPNYRIRRIGSDEVRALTHFKDETPELRGITRKLVRYKRADGVPLSFTLYLPPGYKEGTRLPTVVWAYPREFTDVNVAGQVVGSTNRYTTLGGTSHLFFLLAGYAVLDDASMPVVGTPEKANDTFVEQIVASAKAAIDEAVRLGVTDPDRVGVGGHSYGAFMTANLLAHSDLFRAGIARSGAYNRTLTPFGFQSERRTLWQAPEIYARMSPFMFAHQINEPILLIHGEADNNPGTFPIQSERLFQAIRGHGGTVRYVSLPYESHGYAAKESVEHTLYEMLSWFDKYVKNAPPRSSERSE